MARESEAIAERRRALGERLATFRRAAGLTQAQLARTLTYDRSTLAHIERGRSRADERFWHMADDACAADGGLLAAFHDLAALQAEHEQRARQHHLAEARAKADWFRGGAPTKQPAPVEVATSPGTLDGLRRMVLGRASRCCRTRSSAAGRWYRATREGLTGSRW